MPRNVKECRGAENNIRQSKMPGLRHHFPHHGRQTNVFDAWLQFLHAMPRDQKNAMLDSDFDFFKSNAEHMDATDPVHAMCFDSMRTTLGGL